MLTDLERRTGQTPAPEGAKPVLHGLSAGVKSPIRSPGKRTRVIILSVLVIGSVGLAITRLWPILIPLVSTIAISSNQPVELAPVKQEIQHVGDMEAQPKVDMASTMHKLPPTPMSPNEHKQVIEQHTVVPTPPPIEVTAQQLEPPVMPPKEVVSSREKSPAKQETPKEIKEPIVVARAMPITHVEKKQQEVAAKPKEKKNTKPAHKVVTEKKAKPTAKQPRQQQLALVNKVPEKTMVKTTVTGPIEHAQQIYQLGLDYLSQGRIAEAEERFRTVLNIIPDDTKTVINLSQLLLQNGRIYDAQLVLENAYILIKDSSEISQLLARIYMDQERHADALTILESKKKLANRKPDYLALLGAAYQQAKNYDKASQAYQQALVQRPHEGRWWLGMGLALESNKKLTAAQRAYQRALGTDNLPPQLLPFTRKRKNIVTQALNR